MKASAFERLFRKTKLYLRLQSLNEAKTLSQESVEVLNYIDYRTKTWKKTGFKVTYCPEDYDESKTKVFTARAEISTKLRVAKERIHSACDPPFLDSLSKFVDVRNWDVLKFESNLKLFKEEFLEAVLNSQCESFLRGIDLNVLEAELNRILEVVKKTRLLPNMMKEDHIIDQWRIILEHPLVQDTLTARKFIRKLQLLPNSQAGCERSNGKYARFKNKYSISYEIYLQILPEQPTFRHHRPPLNLGMVF